MRRSKTQFSHELQKTLANYFEQNGLPFTAQDLRKKNTLHIYNLKAQEPDERDHKLGIPLLQGVPDETDLITTGFMPEVWDQNELGACSSFSSTGADRYNTKKQGLPYDVPSFLFQYYNERLEDGDVNEDSGSTIRQACKTLAKYGVCPDSLWPYDISKFAVKPPQEAYDNAVKHQVTRYATVTQSDLAIKQTIVSGFPIAFGTTVFESFESEATAETGIVTLPQSTEQCLGGHALLLVGYFKTIVVNGITLTDVFKIRNSWSNSWGDKGYCYFPADYILNPNLTFDFWVIYSVEA